MPRSAQRLLLILLTVHLFATPAFFARDGQMFHSSPQTQLGGAICSKTFLRSEVDGNDYLTVKNARVRCTDFQRSTIYGGFRKKQWRTISLGDVEQFYGLISKAYDGTNLAKTFFFFADSGRMCLRVKFKSYSRRPNENYFSAMSLELLGSATNVNCTDTKVDRSVRYVVCIQDNCTLPTPSPPTSPLKDPNDDRVSSSLYTVRACLGFLGDTVVSASTYNQHRLWVIVAGVACNLVSMAFLAGLIHYCMKYRHLRKHFRLHLTGGLVGPGTGSLAGTVSPTPAVRHLGSTQSTMLAMSHGGGGHYPDYQYSSIARRKFRAQQRQQHMGGHPDDETLSYRSDQARLLHTNGGLNHYTPTMGIGHHPGHHGSLAGSVGGGASLQRHNSGAVSPPRGWGPSDAPSTPGSMRRHDSVSGMSMVSASGHPRRNGNLPAIPAPKSAEPPATVVY